MQMHWANIGKDTQEIFFQMDLMIFDIIIGIKKTPAFLLSN
jgi:hypothetical protein